MYDPASIREYCLSKRATTEDTPFGEGTLVFRVATKMYALLALDTVPSSVNLKCDPDRAIELRERFDGVRPGYHQNKKHWNTVMLDGSVPIKDVREMIDHSYDLVARGLKRAERAELGIS